MSNKDKPRRSESPSSSTGGEGGGAEATPSPSGMEKTHKTRFFAGRKSKASPAKPEKHGSSAKKREVKCAVGSHDIRVK